MNYTNVGKSTKYDAIDCTVTVIYNEFNLIGK
jgi:hypothetical protein